MKTLKVYFVTHRTSKYPVEKNAVMGIIHNDDSWVVTDHYDSEEKMTDAVFEEIINNEILDHILEGIETSREESDKRYNKLVKLFPVIALQTLFYDDQEKMHKEFNKTCKQMTLENKKRFIKIVKEYYGDEFKTWVGISYGVAKIKLGNK